MDWAVKVEHHSGGNFGSHADVRMKFFVRKDENVDGKPLPTIFHGHSIDMSSHAEPKHIVPLTPIQCNVSPQVTSTNSGQQKNNFQISVYDEDDIIVKNPNKIYPFGQQSIQGRVLDLQTEATAAIPDVSTLP